MAVSGIKGTGIGAVTQPYMGMGDESSGLTIGGEQPTMLPFGIDRLIGGTINTGLDVLDVLGGNIENLPPLTPPKSTGTFTAGDTPRTLFTGDGQFLDDELSMLESSLAEKRGIKTPQMTPEELESQQKDEQSGVDGSAEFTGNVTDEGLEDITKMALQDYLDQARPGTQPKDYKEYIKEFADATGLDVSGKPDKSTALMALGLSLMQNRAGKGFDVGKMLGAVGEAGEAALPAYQKAKSEARALRAKAGEYALGRRKEDEAKAQQRNFMYVVPKQGKGATEKERLADRMMRGRYIRVNSSELNALDTNEDFNKNYEFLPPNALTSMKDLFKAPESPYSDKFVDYSLFSGAEDDFTVKTYAPKPGNTNLSSRAVSASEITRVQRNIENGLEAADRIDSRFKEFGQRFQDTPPNFFNQVGSSIIQLGQSFGVGLPDDYESFKDIEDDVAYQKRFTEYLATRYAPQILQEAGKTISDADRQRVQQIVGEIALLKSPAGVAARMQDLHEFIVLAQRRNMETAIIGLNEVGGNMQPPKMSDEERQRYNSLLAKYKPGGKAYSIIENQYADSITPSKPTEKSSENE